MLIVMNDESDCTVLSHVTCTIRLGQQGQGEHLAVMLRSLLLIALVRIAVMSP
uniref:Uncharacterized protein n=1 Tax=Arundo donax TaxID=35708 RepID=A0A0A9I1X7_ARUDO